METSCHPSYPLNSENASPPGTFSVYLSWAARTRPTRTHTSTTTTDSSFFIFLSHFLQNSDSVRESSAGLPPCSNRTLLFCRFPIAKPMDNAPACSTTVHLVAGHHLANGD